MTQCKEIHTTNLVRKILTYWGAIKFIVVCASFSKHSISFENLNFIFANKYYELSSKKLQAYFVDFDKMSAKYPILNNHVLSIIHYFK